MQSRRDPSPLPSTEENPWLAASSTAGPSRKRNTVLNANSSAVEKTAVALKKAKSVNGVSSQVDDEAVEIETDGNKLLQQRKRKETVASDDEDEDELLPRKRVGFKQRDLVSEAFAGDNVVQVGVA
jgi:U3 small nucleolar RNA-associated protein 14